MLLAKKIFYLFFAYIFLQGHTHTDKLLKLANQSMKPSVKNTGKPNFVIILIDDLGWADVGFNGSKFYQTPNLDSLAKRSIQFINAYAASPVCSPTRAALLTGKHPARLRITDWLPGRPDQPSQRLLRATLKDGLPLAETTLPEALKSAGYVSAHIGKWHLGDSSLGPLQQGFSKNIGGDHTGTPASYFYPYENETHRKWKIPGLEGGQPNEYLTDRLTEEAEHFIEQNKQQPFFLYLAHFAVHIPMKAKDELVEKYKALANLEAPQHNAIYAAMIESVDQSVANILKKLKELQLDENTVVIFTSDNGGLSVREGPNTPATSNAPLREGKGHLYEGGIKVPLLVYLPEQKDKGLISSEPVSLIDLYPTVLELAGLKTANEDRLDGKSLVPLWSGQSFPNRNLYWHYPHYSNQGGRPGWATREGDYKLVEFFEEGDVELYNLKEDVSEKNNLARKLPQKTAALKTKLHKWGEEVDAQFMTKNSAYKSSKN